MKQHEWTLKTRYEKTGECVEVYPAEVITQQCECCGYWVKQQELVWDLEEDRLVCKLCYLAKEVDKCQK